MLARKFHLCRKENICGKWRILDCLSAAYYFFINLSYKFIQLTRVKIAYNANFFFFYDLSLFGFTNHYLKGTNFHMNQFSLYSGNHNKCFRDCQDNINNVR